MLCEQCHQKEATVHYTTIMDGVQQAMDLCADCSVATGLDNLIPENVGALSVIGKKCEFCGQEAESGITASQSKIYWCYECGLEFGRIFQELSTSESPDLMQQKTTDRSFPNDPVLLTWFEGNFPKALEILRERKQQKGLNNERIPPRNA